MLLTVIDYVFFVIFAANVAYLLLFALLSLVKLPAPKPAPGQPRRRVAILIPAYKEDGVIEECAQSALEQQYPRELFEVVVISDHMTDDTNARLARLPLRLIVVNFEKSTKARALNFAMAQIGDQYDVAVILDADNIISPTFLNEVNAAFDAGSQAVQAHRVAKNMNTHVAVLDALSEEINNSLLRKGHAVVGMSAALIGSGMAFDYSLLRQQLSQIDAVGGFDKALDLTLTGLGIRVAYLQHTLVEDEKVQSSATFSNQRRRWISAQVHYFKTFAGKFFPQLVRGNLNFCDKLLQNMLIPRIILIGAMVVVAAVTLLFSLAAAIKWWVLLAAMLLTMMLATPRKMYGSLLFRALIMLPKLFLLFAANLFKLRSANKTFIHTPHGIEKQ